MANLQIFQKICAHLKAGKPGALASIIDTKGSTPTGSQSKIFIIDNGAETFGTVGGGCVEAQIITDSRTVFETGKISRNIYQLTEDDIEAGLICGGSIEVMTETVDIDSLPLYETLIENCESGVDSVLVTFIQTGSVVKKLVVESNNAPANLGEFSKFSAEITETAESALAENNPRFLYLEDTEILIEPVEGLYSVIIFGGGHISKALAAALKPAGFSICIVDDRLKFVSEKRFPEADKLVCGDYHDVFSKLNINQKTYLIIVTRGHAYDEAALEQAVKTSAGYIGMVGSYRKISAIYNHLKERGISPDKLENVFSPMGLDIGSGTVEEIAVSVTAELIKFRRQKNRLPARHLTDKMNRYFEKPG